MSTVHETDVMRGEGPDAADGRRRAAIKLMEIRDRRVACRTRQAVDEESVTATSRPWERDSYERVAIAGTRLCPRRSGA
jgi:hypothetical protein